MTALPYGGKVEVLEGYQEIDAVKGGPGFTLLEVMIALAIMAGVILTVISSFNYHLSVVNRDRDETIAVILARAKLDDPGFQAERWGERDLRPRLAGNRLDRPRSNRRITPG